MNTPRFLLYTRQSLTKGEADESLSLAFQERALRELVKKQGGSVIEPVIIDADEKGWDPHRPGIRQLLERTERDRPDGVAVYAVSRFARDNWLAEGIWRQLLSIRPELQFLSATEPHAQDDMVRAILGVISQAERKRMGAFLKSAFAERVRQGKHHGKLPYGYQKDDDGRLVIVPEERDRILGMIERFEADWSLRRITKWMREQEESERYWDASSVRYIIGSPTIAGAVRSADVITWGSHEPIVSREHHERLVAKIASRRPIRKKLEGSWLERLVICGCGAPMDLHNFTPNRTKGKYPGFRCVADPARDPHLRRRWAECTSRPRSILKQRVERLTPEVLIAGFEHVKDWRDVEDELLRTYNTAARTGDRDRQRIEKSITRLQDERERMLLLYRRATLDVERWEEEDAKIGAQLSELKHELAAIPSPPTRDALREQSDRIARLADHMRIVVSGDPQELGRIMRQANIRVQLDNGGIRIAWPDDMAPFFSES